MVSIRKAKQGFTLRQRNQRGILKDANAEQIGLMVGGLCVGVLLIILVQSMGGSSTVEQQQLLRQQLQHPHPHLLNQEQKPMGDEYNAMALDIMQTLGCDKLFVDTMKTIRGDMDNGEDQAFERRRLQQHGDDAGFGMSNSGDRGGNSPAGDDKPEEEEVWGRKNDDVGNQVWGGGHGGGGGGDFGGGNSFDDQFPRVDDVNMGDLGDFDGGFGYVEYSGKHLFCLAAMETPPEDIRKNLSCDAANTRRQSLLNLWSAARSQMSEDLLVKVLDLARESSSQILLEYSYNLWAPSGDEGLTYLLNIMNSENVAENGGIHELANNLNGNHKLFVDVGSCLGISTLAVHRLYPKAKIVSVEPASPNWLLQEMNLRCNLEDTSEDLKKIHVVLAGVGPNSPEEDNTVAKLLWRPTVTTSTRSWTPASEHHDSDVELLVRLRRLQSILAEANVFLHEQSIDVLNVDCEGCEYNLIPGLSESEFEAIPTIMGSVHWGYIPTSKLPSSQRGKTTHSRMCSHERIASITKECCAFPDLPVRSGTPGEVLVKDKSGQFPPQSSTVSDVIQKGMCDGFEAWAEEHMLNAVADDWGWLELTSEA